jgi:hypothetical protein
MPAADSSSSSTFITISAGHGARRRKSVGHKIGGIESLSFDKIIGFERIVAEAKPAGLLQLAKNR